MKRTFIALVFFVSFALAACSGDIPYLPDELPEVPTSLELTTQPGATVYLGGTQYGPVPSSGTLLIENIPPGSQELSVEHPNYRTETRMVTLREFRRTTERVNLLLTSESDDSVRLTVSYYAGSVYDIGPTARLVGDSGEYVCEPSDFERPKDILMRTWHPYLGQQERVFAYETDCSFDTIPFGPYELVVDATGFERYVEPVVINVSPNFLVVHLGYSNPILRADTEPGSCQVGSMSAWAFVCESVELTSLGTTSFAGVPHEYVLVNTTVRSHTSSPMQLIEPMLVGERWSDGRSWIVSEPMDPGETISFLSVMKYPSAQADDLEAPELVLDVLIEDRDSYIHTPAVIGFRTSTMDSLSGVPVERCERRIDGEVFEYLFETLDQCLRSSIYSSLADARVREFCRERPAFVGSMELVADNITLYGRIACERIAEDLSGSCHFEDGLIGFSCERFETDLLVNTNVRTMEIEIANRLDSQVDVVNATIERQIDFFEYELCAFVPIDESYAQGDRSSISFDFSECDAQMNIAPDYRITLNLLVRGEPSTVSYSTTLPR